METQENEISASVNRRHVYLECQCGEPSHVFRVELDTWDDGTIPDPELSITMQMNPHPSWYRRLYYSIRYIFNKPVDYAWGGHWDSVVLDGKAVDKLQEMITVWKVLTKIRKAKRQRKSQINK